MNLQEIRERFPEYADLSDADLAQALHQAFYSDMPFDAFTDLIGFNPGVPEELQAVAGSSLSPGIGGAVDAAVSALAPGVAGNPMFPIGLRATAAQQFLERFQREPTATALGAAAPAAGLAGLAAPAATQAGVPLAKRFLQNRLTQAAGGGFLMRELLLRAFGGND